MIKSQSCILVNELGREIRFVVQAGPETVRVFVSGPDSECNHEWTRWEAERLRSMLNNVLG